ncbi:MAG: hypothetical protein C3F11_06675 [Methylocystaceae bacterium]|nr:MAG: hypothetical protein C3F11_06675 [Methylocystaceae bacterium]
MRLFHFSENPDIATFAPRSVRIPAKRPPGREWLNGPLVWAVDERRQAMYLFPRDCPRILIWPTATTADEDRDHWFGGRTSGVIAFVERSWLDEIETQSIYRYELPRDSFEDLDDAGMWVSRSAVEPLRVDELTALPRELRAQGVELRVVDRLLSLRGVFEASFHASGIRLRNARA